MSTSQQRRLLPYTSALQSFEVLGWCTSSVAWFTLFLVPAMGQGTQESCALAGVVSNMRTGAPVSQATMYLTALGGEADLFSEGRRGQLGVSRAATASQYAVRSDSNGKFCFKGVEAGQYRLSGRKRGFLETNYGATTPAETGVIVDVRPRQFRSTSFALFPHSTVSGVVLDAGSEAVDAGTVQVISRLWIRGAIRHVTVRGARLNDLGEFRVAQLSPGTYYVLLQPAPGDDPRGQELDEKGTRIRPVRTFHPAATSLAQAAPIQVGLGEDVQNVDIRVQKTPTYRLRGTITGAAQPTHLAAISISPEDTDSPALVAGSANVGPNNSFDFPDVAAGVYRLTYLARSGPTSYLSRGSVEVRDQDVIDAKLDALAPVSIRGKIKVPEGADRVDLSKVQFQLTSIEAVVAPAYNAKVEVDGAFLIEHISVGKYLVSLTPPAGMHLKSARYGQTDIARKEFAITNSGDEMEIVLRNGTAQVEGRIEQPQDARGGGQGLTSGYLLLVPANLSPDGSGLRLGITDPSGTFLVRELPPGSYRVFAFASVDVAAVQNPSVLKAIESFGTDVELKENDKAAITPRVVPADDAMRAFSRSWTR